MCMISYAFYVSSLFFFFKQKTAYEMRISDWSSDVCSSDLSAPPRLAAKIEQATGQGAAFIVIDTPPHADSAASAAVEAADLVLIPCRPSAFDLAAIKTTASLVKMRGKPAFVIFTAGSPTAPRMYDEAAQL